MRKRIFVAKASSRLRGWYELERDAATSEGAPIPIPCQRLRDTRLPVLTLYPLPSPFNGFHRRACDYRLPTLCPLSPFLNPLSVLTPAMSTRPELCSFGVIIRILIQWYLPARMFATVYISTVPAMMSPLKQAEAFLTYWRVADGGIGVRLPV